MPRVLFILSLILALSSSLPLLAQVPGVDTLRLTIDDAVERAVAASPELRRGRLEVERARAARIGAGVFFPELPELEYRHATDAPFHNEGERNWELGIAQEIELGGQSALRATVADIGIRAAEQRVRAAEAEVRAEVREAFARLAAAEARTRLLDSLAAFAHRLDAVAGRLLSAEEISELERNAVRIERARTDLELLSARSAVAGVRAELQSLVRADVGVILTAIVPPLDSVSVARTLAEVTAIETRLAGGDTAILTSRPEWTELELARERAETERRLAGRAIVPSVRVGVSLESETRPVVTGNETLSGELETDRLIGFNLGVKVPLPIPGLYDVGQGEIAVAEVEIQLAAAEQQVLARRIRADVARAAARLRPTAEAISLYAREIAPLVERNLELLERGYRAGELSATELIAQQQQFIRSAEELIEAQLEYAEALADFHRAIGRQ